MPRTPSKTSTPATNGTAYCFFAKQQIAVSGIVTESATGLPLPGVAVMEKGTYNGTVTDENGKYFLELTNGNDAVLVFTYLGFLEKETQVNGRNIINMDMQPDQEQLDEVVVVGYGTQKKINLTEAVSQINSEMLEDRPVAYIDRQIGRAHV